MGKNQHVTPHKEGGWQVKGENNTRASINASTTLILSIRTTFDAFQHDLNLYQDKAILMNIEFRQSMFYFLIQQHGLNKFYIDRIPKKHYFDTHIDWH